MVFQEIAVKVPIGFCSWIKSFENTAFGHTTEVPTIRKWAQNQQEVYVMFHKRS